MSDKINDGGPAFPVVNVHQAELYRWTCGMSLRDWFAGQALAGELSCLQIDGRRFALLCAMAETECETISDTIARECYTIADAMLKARNA